MRKLLNEELPRLSVEEMKIIPKSPIIIILDNVRSHLNVGSVFRSADAFLIEAIYLCGITGIPPHRDIQKTALGATETVSWQQYDSTRDAVMEARKNGYKIVAIEQAETATMLSAYQYDYGDKIALIFGNEVEGVAQEVVDTCDAIIEIPQYGTKHSLNISVAVGVVLWEMVRTR